MKLHLLSLTQDLVKIEDKMESESSMGYEEFNQLDIDAMSIKGQIEATRHLLSVATDIMNSTNERYE
jgi:hypothetical protein